MNFRRTGAIFMFLLVAGWSLQGATLRDRFQTGQRAYFAGEFKRAVSQFEPMVEANPSDARAHFWLGKSYAMLADVNAPLLGMHAGSKAHRHLAKAVQLEPTNAGYRHELFDYLIESDCSRGALREAEALVRSTPASNPDYAFMTAMLEQKVKARSSAEYMAGALFVSGPQYLVSLTDRH